MSIQSQSFYSPFYIFIKEASSLSDQDILTRLKLENYTLEKNKGLRREESSDKRYLYLAEDQHWKHLMDDQYSLWFDQEIRDRLRVLSGEFDIFSCSVGDIDASYDFRYYQKGEIIREFVVEDPKINGGHVVTDSGSPLPGEHVIKKDLLEKVLSIAKDLGVQVQHDLTRIRCYSRPELESEKFIFNEDEY